MPINVHCHGLPVSFAPAASQNAGMRENIAMRAFSLLGSEDDILVLPRLSGVVDFIGYAQEASGFRPEILWTSGEAFTLEDDLLGRDEHIERLRVLAKGLGEDVLILHTYLPSEATWRLVSAIGHNCSLVGPRKIDVARYGTKTCLHPRAVTPGHVPASPDGELLNVPGYVASEQKDITRAVTLLRKLCGGDLPRVRLKEQHSISGSGQWIVALAPDGTCHLPQEARFPLAVEIDVRANRTLSVQYGLVNGESRIWGCTEQLLYPDGKRWRGNRSLHDQERREKLWGFAQDDVRFLGVNGAQTLAGLDIIEVDDPRFLDSRFFRVERNLRVTGAHIQHGWLRLLGREGSSYYAAFVEFPSWVEFSDFHTVFQSRFMRRGDAKGIVLTSFAAGIAGVMAIAPTPQEAEAIFREVELHWSDK